jgi:phenylacetate-CoA ligase
MSIEIESLRELRDVLDHCARHVPLYRGVAAPAPGEDAAGALRRFPVLTKERLRRGFPHDFVPAGRRLADALRSGDVSFVGTSGTSGERVQVLWHQAWWDAQERAGFDLHPLARATLLRPGYREAVLTTPVCSGNLCHVGALPMEERIEAGRTLFLNQTIDPSHWSDREIHRIADELERFAPDALEADPAYLAFFAVRLRRLGRQPFRPAFIDLSYEFPSRRHVATLRRLFGAPVIDAYGSTECGFVFCECEAGRFHHNAAWSHFEVAPLAGLPGIGRLLVTPLRNPWLNLVRFDTGDLVRADSSPCDCGGVAPALAAIEGRAQDVVRAADGSLRTVRAVDRALAEVSGLLHYRLQQRGPREFDLDVIADETGEPDPAHASAALQPVLGVAPAVRRVESVPVEASGKFRLCRARHLDAAALLRGEP